jgi:glutamate-5-semialdehyde dehydrogenase
MRTESLNKIKATHKAKLELTKLSEDQVNMLLRALAEELLRKSQEIIKANQQDLRQLDSATSLYDRALLDTKRIKSIAMGLHSLANYTHTEEQSYQYTHELGFVVERVKVPLGLIGVIYESRPNVTIEVFALCLKSKNALLLKGGKEVVNTNIFLVELIKSVLQKQNINPDVVNLLESSRESVAELLTCVEYLDLIVPRGSASLIEYVRKNSQVPVIETGAGVVHIYFDKSADLEKGKAIITNAKTRRPSVCNSLDTLLIHESRSHDLEELLAGCFEKGVIVYADDSSFKLLGRYEQVQHASQEHFSREFLSLEMSIKTVADVGEAIDFINAHSSKHSESIIAEDDVVASEFIEQVDSACVYQNLSTAFSDGEQFGLAGEVGISTQKLHARGPISFMDLFTYKWIAKGNGQIRA